MNKKIRIINLLLVITLCISACNLPNSDDAARNAAETAAAQTVSALLSATPPILAAPSITLAAPATLTFTPAPFITNTPAATATSNCNVGEFIKDVTVADGTVFTTGQTFTKTWRIRNVGSCTWNGFSLVFDGGDAMGGAATSAVSTLNPGQEVDLSVNLTAPATAGTYRGYWRINTNSGVLVPIVNGAQGKSFYVDIKVQTPTATPTNTSAPVFAVTGVNYVVSKWSDATHTDCPRITANITVNMAGSVDYHWVSIANPVAGPSTNGTLVFVAAGTQSITADWALPAINAPAPDEWTGIYIDLPNKEDFGHTVMPACVAP